MTSDKPDLPYVTALPENQDAESCLVATRSRPILRRTPASAHSRRFAQIQLVEETWEVTCCMILLKLPISDNEAF